MGKVISLQYISIHYGMKGTKKQVCW